MKLTCASIPACCPFLALKETKRKHSKHFALYSPHAAAVTSRRKPDSHFSLHGEGHEPAFRAQVPASLPVCPPYFLFRVRPGHRSDHSGKAGLPTQRPPAGHPC